MDLNEIANRKPIVIHHTTDGNTVIEFPIGTLSLEFNVYLRMEERLSREQILERLLANSQSNELSHDMRINSLHAHNRLKEAIEEL